MNVGGTGKLAMTELAGLCAAAGFKRAKTYIQSGNVVFESSLTEEKTKAKLEKALAAKMGKPVGVLVRTRGELAATLARNPFKNAPPNRVIVLFLDETPPKNALDDVVCPGGEAVQIVGREVFVHFPDGQGTSKLKLPLTKVGTGRNVNTVAKLAAMAAVLEE